MSQRIKFVTFTTEVDCELDADEVVEGAIDIIRSYDDEERLEVISQIYGRAIHEPTRAGDIIDLFATLDATRLEKAIQAIRDQSEHDLQMAIGG